MIHEVATIEIMAGHQSAFEHAVRSARCLFEAAAGFRSIELRHSVEQPTRYLLIVGWETVEHHTVEFHNSAAFARWRELAAPHFAAAPVVEHVAAVSLD